MKVPVSWLREYVDFDVSIEELSEKLTSSGTQVESIDTAGAGCEDIVVGEIVSIDQHPKADRLRVCVVNDGKNDLNVVCGAYNFEPGDKVPLARAGSKLPCGTKIKKTKIRGVESFGMLCAEDELGISDDHSGIMLLPRDTEAGTRLSEVIGPPETVLGLEVTWNRPDCLSIIGVAREVAALFECELKLPSVDFPENGEAIEDLAKVTVKDSEGCPRYTGRILSSAKTGASPSWMSKRLTMCGIRPISNIVDITNYVMLECGHPLHAFDYDLLTDHEIIVRRAKKGETMTTLEGVDRALTSDTLIIADSKRPVALAGVMGGAGSEIRPETDKILLESASFDAPLIRKTSAELDVSTESSYRFERGVNICTVDWASRRAASLMVEHAGAVAAKGVLDVYPSQYEEKRVSCRFDRVRSLLGVDVSGEDICTILNSLQLSVEENDGNSCIVAVPGFRQDVSIEADLIEEVARMYGLDKVPASVPKSMIVPEADDSNTRAVIACRAHLKGLGLSEGMNYSFVSDQLLDVFCEGGPSPHQSGLLPREGGQGVGGIGKEFRVVLPNPVSADHGVLRDSLVPQMVESLGRNLARQVPEASLYEIGKVFFKDKKNMVREEDHLCIGLMGKTGRSGMDKKNPLEREEAFLWLKGIIEALFMAQSEIDEATGVLSYEPMEHPFCGKGEALGITADGQNCGFMGLIRDDICGKWRMIEPVAIAEISLKPLLKRVLRAPVLRPIPAYPAVSRDMALLIDNDVSHEKILKIVRESAPAELTDIVLFDIFKSEGIGVGKKSVAYSLVYRSLERTLTDEEANGYHKVIKEALKEKLKVEIREG